MYTYVNPNVNYELWVIRMCQCRFINGDKCTILVGDADSGGHGKTLYIPLNFVEIALKNSLKKKPMGQVV